MEARQSPEKQTKMGSSLPKTKEKVKALIAALRRKVHQKRAALHNSLFRKSKIYKEEKEVK